MARLKAPCYQCEKREVGCHSTCKEYIEYSNERRKIYEKNAQKPYIRKEDYRENKK